MRIALGVCGGIAAYKAAEICRLLQERGLSVQVIMTESAQQFIRPLTFAALTGNKVITGLWSEEADDDANPDSAIEDSAIEHIAVAQGIDALLVAPATADTLAKFAHGMANDFLSTLYLATTAPVILAPAMNVNMWQHPATRANLDALRARGHSIVEPDAGYLACGMVGTGRLAENERIVEAVLAALYSRAKSAERKHDLAGETVLVTAGPTREPIDPVRFLGNRSSGKMGFALAAAARDRGARVVLIAGPTSAPPPSGVELVRVERTEEMRAAVLQHFASASIVIKAAAVADYKPKFVSGQKLKRDKQDKAAATLELEPTADILAELGRMRQHQVLIGFAAETENILENARKKLAAKLLDAIVVNDVSEPGIGFDSEENAVTILTPSGEEQVPRAPKREVAERILDATVQLLNVCRPEPL